MISFLRKTRQRLLTQNRFSKYLLYAIGEIILVMVGILLALQVNNLNNQKKDRKLETKYLQGLKTDLQADTTNLRLFIIDKQNKVDAAVELLHIVEAVTFDELNQLDSTIWVVFGWLRYNQSTNTLDEMIGSGNLSLIQNDSIKSLILDIRQANIEVVGGTEHMRREYDHYLYDRSAALRELHPLIDYQESHKHQVVTLYSDVNEQKLQTIREQNHALLNDLTFRNGLKLSIGNNYGNKQRCVKLLGDAEKLIALIDQELSKE